MNSRLLYWLISLLFLQKAGKTLPGIAMVAVAMDCCGKV